MTNEELCKAAEKHGYCGLVATPKSVKEIQDRIDMMPKSQRFEANLIMLLTINFYALRCAELEKRIGKLPKRPEDCFGQGDPISKL